ncbi:DNA polymerase IV [bacterium]|nr:DNA polymerase IV [bacterium]
MIKSSPQKRYIIHIDMDAFFAAVEQRDNPQYKGKPVVVGADPKRGKGRGVVSTCSYEARKFGIHSAMPISIAYRKCPEAIFLPVNMEKYQKVSLEIGKVLGEFSPQVEWVSIDEAFLDISGSYHLFGSPYKTGLLLKSRVKEVTGLTSSVGIAPHKFAAKIASDLKKPDGLVEVTQDSLLTFLWPLEINRIWGVGKKAVKVLNESGIYTMGDLAHRKVEKLVELLGKNGEHIWQLANGLDDREVETEREIKSISNEYTFQQDTDNKEKIGSALLSLCEKVSQRLFQKELKAKTITLKIRTGDFKTYSRTVSISNPTNFTDVIFKEIQKTYNNFQTKGKKIRLLGVKASNFSLDTKQSDFLSEKENKKRKKIQRAMEKIKDKFGEDAIYRSGSKI